MHGKIDAFTLQPGHALDQIAMFLFQNYVARGSVFRGGAIHLKPKFVNRIIERQQPNVGLQPGPEVRTQLQHVFRTERPLGGAVESFDVGPLQSHHVERQCLPASRVARIGRNHSSRREPRLRKVNDCEGQSAR